MRSLKVGDRVRLNGKDEYRSVGLIKGVIVTVYDIGEDLVFTDAPGDSYKSWAFHVDEVELVEDSPKAPEVTKGPFFAISVNTERFETLEEAEKAAKEWAVHWDTAFVVVQGLKAFQRNVEINEVAL